jgi:hypothetical protein
MDLACQPVSCGYSLRICTTILQTNKKYDKLNTEPCFAARSQYRTLV